MSVELLPIFFRKPITRNTPEAVVQRCSVKKVFLQFSQNSQENTYGRISFLIKLQASSKFQANFIKNTSGYCFWHSLSALWKSYVFEMRILSLRIFIQTTLFLTAFDVLFALNLVLYLLPIFETDILLLIRLRISSK